MDELRDRCVMQLEFLLDGYHIGQQNRNEQIPNEFYCRLGRYVRLEREKSQMVGIEDELIDLPAHDDGKHLIQTSSV